MPRIRKELIVVGDRLLIRPQRGEERTGAGLYLPAAAVNEQQVRGGRVVKVGPGLPLAEPVDGDELWKRKQVLEPRYLPMQAKEGDYALFLKSAVLVLSRQEIDLSGSFGD